MIFRFRTIKSVQALPGLLTVLYVVELKQGIASSRYMSLACYRNDVANTRSPKNLFPFV